MYRTRVKKHEKHKEHNKYHQELNKELKKQIFKERKELLNFENYISNLDPKRINSEINAAQSELESLKLKTSEHDEMIKNAYSKIFELEMQISQLKLKHLK